MTQHLKPHVRERLVAGAASVFAEQGVQNATMAAIAARAEVAVGNVYRYFPSKEQLLAAVVPDAFAVELRRLLARRVSALGRTRDVRTLNPDAPYSVLSRQSLDFCIEHRERVVILLLGANATPYESFADELGRDLVRWAIAYARRVYPGIRVDRILRTCLEQIYSSYVRALARALARHSNEVDIRAAVGHLAGYHLGGLQRLFERCERGPGRRGPRRSRRSFP